MCVHKIAYMKLQLTAGTTMKWNQNNNTDRYKGSTLYRNKCNISILASLISTENSGVYNIADPSLLAGASLS